MRRELLGVLDEIEADPTARVVILTGAGGHFCSGGDVKTTRALAEKIAAGPPLALRLDKQMLNRAASTDLSSALEAEASSQALAIASDDHAEGVSAFFEKRPPRFTGR